jgi:hypothetical protein
MRNTVIVTAYSLAPIEGNLFASASAAIARKLAANSPSSVTTTESTRLLAFGDDGFEKTVERVAGLSRQSASTSVVVRVSDTSCILALELLQGDLGPPLQHGAALA